MDGALHAYVVAFRDLVRPTDASVDLMWLTPDGHVAKVTEAEPTMVGATGRLVLGADNADNTAEPSWTMLLTAVHIDCAASPPAGGDTDTPGGASFHYGCVVDFDKEDRAVPLERYATVTMHVDQWQAPANRDALARALHSWKELTAQPIVELTSNIHPASIARYGFNFAPGPRSIRS